MNLFCFYRGSYEGVSPYTTGTACSSCDPDASNCVNGLCCKFVCDKINEHSHAYT